MLKPALAPATAGSLVWRNFMYNLIWRSVTCRPGNGGLLSGVKRPIIAQTIATARRCDPIKDHTVASVVPPIGLRPHSGTTLATLSHPDCRSVLTVIVAGHRTKPQIALEQIRRALAEGLPPGVVLGDAAYGVETDFRTALTALSLSYVLGVQSTLGVWPPGCGPLPPKPWSGKGRRPKLQRRDAEHQPVSAKDLALTLPPSAWQTVSWRTGSRGDLSGRFAAVRVRPSHRDYWRAEPHPEEWLLIEWPEGDKEPSKYWLSTLPATTALVDLVHRAKLRWRIERDYQDLKQELGLDHYEGRGWRRFHHHATLCIAAYGFLVRERSLFPPDEPFRRPAPALPPGWRPRGHPGSAGTP